MSVTVVVAANPSPKPVNGGLHWYHIDNVACGISAGTHGEGCPEAQADVDALRQKHSRLCGSHLALGSMLKRDRAVNHCGLAHSVENRSTDDEGTLARRDDQSLHTFIPELLS